MDSARASVSSGATVSGASAALKITCNATKSVAAILANPMRQKIEVFSDFDSSDGIFAEHRASTIQEILKQTQSPVRVLVVWEPMLSTDWSRPSGMVQRKGPATIPRMELSPRRRARVSTRLGVRLQPLRLRPLAFSIRLLA